MTAQRQIFHAACSNDCPDSPAAPASFVRRILAKVTKRHMAIEQSPNSFLSTDYSDQVLKFHEASKEPVSSRYPSSSNVVDDLTLQLSLPGAVDDDNALGNYAPVGIRPAGAIHFEGVRVDGASAFLHHTSASRQC